MPALRHACDRESGHHRQGLDKEIGKLLTQQKTTPADVPETADHRTEITFVPDERVWLGEVSLRRRLVREGSPSTVTGEML